MWTIELKRAVAVGLSFVFATLKFARIRRSFSLYTYLGTSSLQRQIAGQQGLSHRRGGQEGLSRKCLSSGHRPLLTMNLVLEATKANWDFLLGYVDWKASVNRVSLHTPASAGYGIRR